MSLRGPRELATGFSQPILLAQQKTRIFPAVLVCSDNQKQWNDMKIWSRVGDVFFAFRLLQGSHHLRAAIASIAKSLSIFITVTRLQQRGSFEPSTGFLTPHNIIFGSPHLNVAFMVTGCRYLVWESVFDVDPRRECKTGGQIGFPFVLWIWQSQDERRNRPCSLRQSFHLLESHQRFALDLIFIFFFFSMSIYAWPITHRIYGMRCSFCSSEYTMCAGPNAESAKVRQKKGTFCWLVEF